jgi:phospholipid/cholesterol/gamma-HCH transport system substrate-binding protein
MDKNREMIQLQVGAFVAVGLALVMMVLFLLGGEKKLFERHYTLVTKFESISGLRIGAPIHLAGIHVGSVGQVLFEESLETRTVKVILYVNKEYQERIRENSVASIVTQGLLGDKMILITVGSIDQKIIPDGGLLQTKPYYDLTELVQKGEELVTKVDVIAGLIADVFAEVKEGQGLIHALIYDSDGSQAIDSLGKVSKNLQGASYHFRQITRKIDQGDGTIGALVNDASLFNDMKTLLGKANRNKLVRAVIRHTLKTKDEKLLKK